MKKFTNILKPFDIEFQPYIDGINTKEKLIREYADAATMERISCMVLHMALDTIANLI